MDAPPVNRLLQLLRQKPSETSEPSHAGQSHVSLGVSTPQSIPQSNTLSATESDILEINNSSTQPVTESDTQPARQRNRQPVSKSSTQPAKSSTQPVTESDTLTIQGSSTQPATHEEISLAVTGLSKGQQRVLRFLLSSRDASNRSRTIPIGYDAISRHCVLSRSGSRKVIGELCQRGLITRLETKRGETQGSVYHLASIILYATQSSTDGSEKSSTPLATYDNSSCSSNKERNYPGRLRTPMSSAFTAFLGKE
jgi:hypothetical protein